MPAPVKSGEWLVQPAKLIALAMTRNIKVAFRIIFPLEKRTEEKVAQARLTLKVITGMLAR